MRKDTLYIFGSLALFAWVAMTYFLFVHRPNHSVSDLQRSRLESLQDRVHTFEVRLNESLEANQLFLAKIKEAVEQRLSDKAFSSPTSSSSTSAAKSSEKGKPIDGPVKSEPVSEKTSKVSEAVDQNEVIPVVMFACNRVTVNLALDSLLKARKDPKKFPIIVSQVILGDTRKVQLSGRLKSPLNLS